MPAEPPPAPVAEPRRWPVRLILVAIVFALVLPGVVFSGILIARIATVERTRSEEAARAAASRVADALDREVANLSSALLALATSNSLAQRDFAAFHKQATALAASIGQALVLSDADGQQLVNTRRTFGEPLPPMAAVETLRSVTRSRKAAASNLFVGNTSGGPSVVVMYPVVIDDRVEYVLAVSLQPLFLTGLLQQQGWPPGWVAALIDGNDRVIGRTAGAGEFVGETLPPPTGQSIASGIRLTTSLDGTPVMAATQRLRLAEWRVGVGVSLRAIEAPLRGTMLLIGAAGLLTMALAGLLAWQLARSVSMPLKRLAAAGSALGHGVPVQGVRSAIAEVDSVSRALVQATHDLRTRADALAAERAQLAAIIETVPVGLVIAEADGRIVAGNARLEAIVRHPLKRSRSDADYSEWISFHGDGRTVRGEEYPLARVLRGAPHAELQCLYKRGDGTRGWIRFVAAPIRSADGRITGGVVAALDVDELVRARQAEARFADALEAKVAERTEAAEAATQGLRDEAAARAAAEEQLHQSQKMEAVGQLTGGIAHDFNNLLTIVIGSLDLLRRRADDDRSKRLLDNALEGAARAATLTARLLAFSRRQPLSPQPLDVNKLVAGMSDLLHRTLGTAVQLEAVLAGGVWQTHADPNQLENALLNLAVNGRDAIIAAGPDAGRLVIETANATLDASFAPHDKEFHPGDYVRMAVTDSGTGMPPDVVARVFEPFYTTKPQGQGTGLGLSQVHGFVKQSGGHVTIRTAPGEGTTVSIHLPRLLVTASEPAAATPVPEAAHAGLTVLVVEDDSGVRRYSVEALRDLGHVVLEAECGPTALRLLDAHPEIDLLLTDVLLPGMDGPALAATARRRRPGLPILFASGYTGDDNRHDSLVPEGAPLLQKPFTVHALAARIREVMIGG